ncbi:penicillin-binding protein 1A [Tunicatimonas pelagia]|uniref:penicillin-binding protein 1A n=1 Tax=Tunicatimonas pelagia TaxID=931531 RepID=UPI002665C400|nr:transglycosylase domain-containing protein [Tunicatimonas pelagia]WKN43535.1 transglycosylase domain-containing protein [Tunicatimonas pelagia]
MINRVRFFFLQEYRRFTRRPFQFLVFRLFLLGLVGVLSACGLLYAVYSGWFGELPNYAELKDIRNHTASEVYSFDGKLLGRYYIENRTVTTIDKVPPSLLQALVATEDARFYEHKGIDYRSLVRVVLKSVLLQNESSGGGSTLTQQLAKNLFPRQHHGLLTMPVNKIREAITAHRIENLYAKDEILMLYLNTVPFGGNVYGIEAASRRFFNRSATNLKVEESAVLVGMLKATTAYSPRLYPERAQQRRNVVLSQMNKYEYLNTSSKDSLQALPLEIDYNFITHNTGLAPYFREKLRHEVQQWLNEHPKEDGTTYNLYTDGLKVYTTIDARLQRHAENAVKKQMQDLQKTFDKHWEGRRPWGEDETMIRRAMVSSDRYKRGKHAGKSDEEIHAEFTTPTLMTVFSWEGETEKTMTPLDSIRYYQLFLNAGFLAMRPENGHIKAWVGGIDHKYFQYDHVTAKRQVGSTFKPVVYAAALESGADPCEYISNERRIYADYKDWSPGNSDGKYNGYYSMQGALTHSVNTVAVDLMMNTGVERVVDLAHRMGVQNDLPEEPAIALGTADLSLYEMLTVYSTFVNRGMTVKPIYVLGIEDQQGNEIVKFNDKPEFKRTLSQQTADLMVQMMKSVVDSGTARRIRYRYGIKNDMIGKTGTTQSHADGWFIGATPKLVAGAWVGGDNRLVRFRNISLGQGANTALPIWANFMKSFTEDATFKKLRYARFPQPSRWVQASLACDSYREDKEEGFLRELFAKKDRNDEKPERLYPPNSTRRQPARKKKQPEKKVRLKDVIRSIFGGN